MMSYRKEYLAGDAGYNLVSIIMAEKGVELGGAIEQAAIFHAEISDNFIKVREDVLRHTNGIPSWGDSVDAQVARYIDGLGWCRLPRREVILITLTSSMGSRER